MGNEQSTPTPRGGPRHKLTKPRTNSSANASNVKGSAPPSRRNSQSNHVGISNNTYSTLSVDKVVREAGEKRDESKQRKRMSIFRSKSSQPKVQQLDIGSAANINYLEQSPLDNWTRNIPGPEDLSERHCSVPLERYFPWTDARI
jgi:hypothetical protein